MLAINMILINLSILKRVKLIFSFFFFQEEKVHYSYISISSNIRFDHRNVQFTLVFFFFSSQIFPFSSLCTFFTYSKQTEKLKMKYFEYCFEKPLLKLYNKIRNETRAILRSWSTINSASTFMLGEARFNVTCSAAIVSSETMADERAGRIKRSV